MKIQTVGEVTALELPVTPGIQITIAGALGVHVHAHALSHDGRGDVQVHGRLDAHLCARI